MGVYSERAPNMDITQAPPTPLPDPYTLICVHAVPAPRGADGTRWHRYEIGQGTNVIVGYIQGASASVTRAAEEIVLGLNERRALARGRVHLALGSRGR